MAIKLVFTLLMQLKFSKLAQKTAQKRMSKMNTVPLFEIKIENLSLKFTIISMFFQITRKNTHILIDLKQARPGYTCVNRAKPYPIPEALLFLLRYQLL
ncbi:hypothetical protein OB13_05670 [Pontibacter sp. HJ8]